MPVMIDDSLAYRAMDNGVKLGELSATRESKGAFSEVFLLDGKLYSCVYDGYQDANFCCGNEISLSELKTNVDNYEKATSILNDNGIDMEQQ